MHTWIILKIAIRNVFLHRMRSLIVGTILIFSAVLAVVGHSFVAGIANGMMNSTTQSITGDIQIYSEKAKEALSVFGNMDGSPTDVGHVENFKQISDLLKTNPKIASVVPMGTSFAQLNPGNILDHFLEKLRKSYKDSGVTEADRNSQKKRIRFLAEEIKKNLSGKFEEIGILSASDVELTKENLERITGDEYWNNFDQDPENNIEFLANKIAPLIFDDNMIFFNYVGTDPDAFKENFPQFEIVKGQQIPQGQRGFLFHDYFYENQIKHRIARRLDQIKKTMKDDKQTIAASKELQDKIKANIEQSAEIYLQLGPIETSHVAEKLRVLLKIDEKDFRTLVKTFLNMTDADFKERYDFFYKEIAPYVVLYRVQVGEVLPLNAFTKTGSSTSVNVKVYGTFKFKSFENSPLAGTFSIMDLISFRELYGFMTEERRNQNKELEKEMGLSDVARDSIEDLFAGTSTVGETDESSQMSGAIKEDLNFQKKVIGSGYTSEELSNGVFMHAAVLLKDHHDMASVIDDINKLSKEKLLGLKAVSWQDAAGMIGQMTFMMKAVLNIFIGISLLLAGFMIMNSLLMAAMNRKQEIGTMRAIGASRDFIYKMFFFETLFISIFFGGIGVGIGSLIVLALGKSGIPASGDVATFFFSGPKLYLHLNPALLLVVIFIMVIIAVIATQYPAWKAMKISPLQAMQKRE